MNGKSAVVKGGAFENRYLPDGAVEKHVRRDIVDQAIKDAGASIEI